MRLPDALLADLCAAIAASRGDRPRGHATLRQGAVTWAAIYTGRWALAVSVVPVDDTPAGVLRLGAMGRVVPLDDLDPDQARLLRDAVATWALRSQEREALAGRMEGASS